MHAWSDTQNLPGNHPLVSGHVRVPQIPDFLPQTCCGLGTMEERLVVDTGHLECAAWRPVCLVHSLESSQLQHKEHKERGVSSCY